MNIGLSLGSAAMSALLGRQIVSQAITDASSTIYTSVGEVFHHTSSIDKVLCKLDINNKVKAFLKYKSQVKKFPHPRSKEAIVNLSRVRGGQAFVEYAEAFKVEKILD